MAAAGNRRRATIRRIASRPGRPRGWTAGALGLAMLAAGPGAAQDVAATAGDFGGVGLIEMRNARFRPDGTLEAGAAFRRQRQFWFLGFQALPFLETTFRLTDRLDATAGRGATTDRAFDVKARLWEESAWRPALAMGAQDVIGTGLYAGEYLVASKRLWDLDLTLGLGWGRLGTGADLGNPLGALSGRYRARSRTVGVGGRPGLGSLFRGRDAAIFGGLEWSVPPALALGLEGLRAKLEWSGDALRDERGGYPTRITGLRGQAATRLNIGLQWQPNPWLDAGVHFVHGTDLLLRLSLRLDPAQPPAMPRPPPPALPARPEAAAEDTVPALPAALRRAGFRPLEVTVAGTEARVAVAGGRQPTLAQVAGRVARAVQPLLPAEVERIAVEWHRAGLPVARLVLLRGAMEAAAQGAGSAEEILASAALSPAEPLAGFRPDLGWALEPRIALQLGDPRVGVRWQASGAAGLRLGLGEGYALAGSLAQAVAGNLDKGLPSDSVLPRVRSDLGRYAREGRTAIPTLYAERLWSPADDWFARLSAGLLEPMFGGIAGEVLWRPQQRPLALGLDLAWVVQRDYRQGLGALGYSVATGHASVYADLPIWNLGAVLRAGRYLAGDWGGTLEVSRRFDSGIEIGGFATLTTTPFRRFGEGSFDKGIFLRFPLQLLGPETASRATALIRPVVRDGGQRLALDNPLFEVAREGRAEALGRDYLGLLR